MCKEVFMPNFRPINFLPPKNHKNVTQNFPVFGTVYEIRTCNIRSRNDTC